MDRQSDKSGDGHPPEEGSRDGQPPEGAGDHRQESDEATHHVKPSWRFANQLGIQRRTAEILRLAIKATGQQLEAERKRLKKLTYGS